MPRVSRAWESIRLRLPSARGGHPGGGAPLPTPIAELYDDWSRQVTEDVAFYVEEAVEAGGPVVELGVGTGRIAVPTALAGISRDRASTRRRGCSTSAGAGPSPPGVAELLDLRLGRLRRPPVTERVCLVTCPFRALPPPPYRRRAARRPARCARAARAGGRLVFDVFAPSDADIEETDGRWLEREPGSGSARTGRRDDRRLDLSVRGDGGETTMPLAWLPPEAGDACSPRRASRRIECYGWFDGRPYRGGEDTVWVAQR